MKTITFTREKLHELKVAYNWAVAQGHEQFKFEGQDVLTAYAKYLIQYLELKFGSKLIQHTDGEMI